MKIKKWLKFTENLLDLEEDIKPKIDNVNLLKFLSDKKFKNPKSKIFIYHGTDVSPDKFELNNDYEGWDEFPPGYLFLSTDIKEASSYGEYVIPCELERYDNKYFNVYSDNPSRVFDMDYGIDLYKPDNYVGFWEKFEQSGKAVLIIKGNKKMTLITDIDNVIPRTDLAKEFYS